jgi:hypothetical protein
MDMKYDNDNDKYDGLALFFSREFGTLNWKTE